MCINPLYKHLKFILKYLPNKIITTKALKSCLKFVYRIPDGGFLRNLYF